MYMTGSGCDGPRAHEHYTKYESVKTSTFTVSRPYWLMNKSQKQKEQSWNEIDMTCGDLADPWWDQISVTQVRQCI